MAKDARPPGEERDDDTFAVRAKLTTRRSPATHATGRHLTQVLAVRRSLRRSEAQTTR